MKTSLLIIIGIIVAVAGILVFTTIVFDDFAISLCDSWFFNTCVNIWEDTDCHRPGSGCIMSEQKEIDRKIWAGISGIPLEYYEEQFGIEFEDNFTMPSVCTVEMISHIEEYTNMFEDGEFLMVEWPSLPESIDAKEYDLCFKQLEYQLFHKNTITNNENGIGVSASNDTLSLVLELCDITGAQGPRIVYLNETHVIDNKICEWDERTNSSVSLDGTVYSLPFGMSQQDVKLQLHVDPQYVKNSHGSDELILDIDAMMQVQKILNKCEYIQKLESGEIQWRNPDGSFNVIHGDLPFFNNGTHYIDSNYCNWVDSLEFITYNCFEANPMEQSWYSGPAYFYNSTHHLDAQQCEWTIFSEEYWDLPLCNSNFEHNFGKCREFQERK